MSNEFIQYQIAALITTVTTAILATLVLFWDHKRELTRMYSIYTFAISGWSLCWLRMITSSNQSSSLFWARFLHFPAALIPATFLHFTQCLLSVENQRGQKILRFATYILGSLFIAFSFDPKFVQSSIPKLGFRFYLVPGPYYFLFVFFFILTTTIIHWIMVNAFKKETHIKRTQIGYVFGAYALGYAGGAAVFLPDYGFRLPAYSLYCIPLCHLAIAYTILRYRLMEFGLLIRFGLAYALLIMCLTSIAVPVLYLLEKLSGLYFKSNPGITTLIIGAIFFMLWKPLQQRINRFVDQFVFHSPDFQLNLAAFAENLAHSSSIDELANYLHEHIKKLLKTSHVGLAVWDYKQSAFTLLPAQSFVNDPISKIEDKITRTDFLVRTLETERRLFRYGIVIDDEITTHGQRAMAGERTTLWKIRRTMRWLGAKACVPLLHKFQLIGFIILGELETNRSYNDEDKKFLAHMADIVTNSLKTKFDA